MATAIRAFSQHLEAQASRLAVPSRAYFNDTLGPFLAALCERTGLDAAVPMNTGAEAVETAIKRRAALGLSRQGYSRITRPQIIVADGNFHGRTTTIVGFSSEPDYRDGFGPFAPGFVLGAVRRSAGDEARDHAAYGGHSDRSPFRARGGIIVPPNGYLAGLRQLCDEHRVLLILDEVQSGLGRAGNWFAFQHEGVVPDGIVLGKALGGGVLPVSAFVARREVMDVFTPGSHGSTFGGNPLAAAVGLEALRVIDEEGLVERSHTLGEHMFDRLRAIRQSGAEGGAGTRALGRRGDRSEAGQRARCLSADAGQGRACRRTRTAPSFAWRRRW